MMYHMSQIEEEKNFPVNLGQFQLVGKKLFKKM